MIDILLSGLFLFLITFLFKEPIRNWLDKEPSDKYLKKLRTVENGKTFAVVDISDDPENSDMKLMMFQDLARDSIINLNLPYTHDFLNTFDSKKIITIEYSVMQYKDIKIRVYPLLPEIETYKRVNLNKKLKEIEIFKKTSILFCFGFISMLIIGHLLNLFL